jgi:hypothetical protein
MSEVVSTKGSLVMIGLNTDKPQVYFNGSEITGVIGLNVVNNKRTQTVVLKVSGSAPLVALQEAGVVVVQKEV